MRYIPSAVGGAWRALVASVGASLAVRVDDAVMAAMALGSLVLRRTCVGTMLQRCTDAQAPGGWRRLYIDALAEGERLRDELAGREPDSSEQRAAQRARRFVHAGQPTRAFATLASAGVADVRSARVRELMAAALLPQREVPPVVDELDDEELGLVDIERELAPVVALPPPTGEQLRAYLSALPKESAGGMDKLVFEHLQVAAAGGGAGADALAALVGVILRGEVGDGVRRLLRMLAGTPLRKGDAGVRPISVASVLWRVAMGWAVKHLAEALRPLLTSYGQYGVGVQGAVEHIVFTARQAVAAGRAVCKADRRGAYQSICRSRLRRVVLRLAPCAAPLLDVMYGGSGVVCFDGERVVVDDGVAQGDPFGSLAEGLCDALQTRRLRRLAARTGASWGYLASSSKSLMDDTVLFADNVADADEYLRARRVEDARWGQAHAHDKAHTNAPGSEEFTQVDVLTVLGVPVAGQTQVEAQRKAAKVVLGLQRLAGCELLPLHQQLYVAAASAGTPRVSHMMRSASVIDSVAVLGAVDDASWSVVRQAGRLSDIDKFNVEQFAWPASMGGFGVGGAALAAPGAALGGAVAALRAARGEAAPRKAQRGACTCGAKPGCGNGLCTVCCALSGRACASCVVEPLDALFELAGVADAVHAYAVVCGVDDACARRAVCAAAAFGDTQRCLNRPMWARRCAAQLAQESEQLRARVRLAALPGGRDWLCASPCERAHTLLGPDALALAVRLRLGVPVCADGALQCAGCVATRARLHEGCLDAQWAAVRMCKAGLGATAKVVHDCVRDALAAVLRGHGLYVRVEAADAVRAGTRGRLRPADLAVAVAGEMWAVDVSRADADACASSAAVRADALLGCAPRVLQQRRADKQRKYSGMLAPGWRLRVLALGAPAGEVDGESALLLRQLASAAALADGDASFAVVHRNLRAAVAVAALEGMAEQLRRAGVVRAGVGQAGAADACDGDDSEIESVAPVYCGQAAESSPRRGAASRAAESPATPAPPGHVAPSPPRSRCAAPPATAAAAPAVPLHGRPRGGAAHAAAGPREALLMRRRPSSYPAPARSRRAVCQTAAAAAPAAASSGAAAPAPDARRARSAARAPVR